MKKLARKSAVALAVVLTSAGLLALPTSAEADTGWGFIVAPGRGDPTPEQPGTPTPSDPGRLGDAAGSVDAR